MRWPHVSVTLPLGLLVALAGCPGDPHTSREGRQVRAVLERQARAMRSEDRVAYIDTLDPANPQRAELETLLPPIFAAYDVECTYEELTVTAVQDGEAHVDYTQRLTQVGGQPGYPNSRIIGTYVLKQGADGEWRVLRNVVRRTDFL